MTDKAKQGKGIEKAKVSGAITITPANFKTGVFRVRGIAPFVQNKFPQKVKEMLIAQQEAGSTAKKGKKRDPKDFQACYEAAIHRDENGKTGIPASGLRAALVSACRIVGFQMTRAKLAVFVEADGFDPDDGTPLVHFIKGKPQQHNAHVRNATGVVDIRARAMWKAGWEADIRITFDADVFTLEDIGNLLYRAGKQVGVGEGRPDSKKSTGMGWGTFEVITRNELKLVV